jgi:hypothetical protein
MAVRFQASLLGDRCPAGTGSWLITMQCMQTRTIQAAAPVWENKARQVSGSKLAQSGLRGLRQERASGHGLLRKLSIRLTPQARLNFQHVGLD